MDHNYLDSIFQQIVINFYLWAMATKSANNNKPDFGSYTMTVATKKWRVEKVFSAINSKSSAFS